MRWCCIALLISCLITSTSGLAKTAKPSPIDPDQVFSQALEARLLDLQILQASGEPLPLYFSQSLVDFYAQRNYRAVWSAQSLSQLIHEIALLETDGLNPQDYSYNQLKLALPIVSSRSLDAIELRVNDELKATAAYLTALYHLYFGKVDPETNLPQWQFSLGLLTNVLGDSITAVDQIEIHQLFEKARPDHPLYSGLRQALADYRLQEKTAAWPVLPNGPTLKPCMIDPQVLILRERLRATGEFTATATEENFADKLAACIKIYPPVSSSSSVSSSSIEFYDELSAFAESSNASQSTEYFSESSAISSVEEISSSSSSSINPDELFDLQLVGAVKQFQRNQYLEPDAVVGPGTRAALNISVQSRIDQIRVNLDRARALLRRIPDDLVLVDVAGYKITYYKSRQAVWSSRVQVGMAYRTTPIFRSDIHLITLNPTWTVPPTILRKDVLPKVRENPAYLTEHNIRVFDAQGNQLDASQINWQSPGAITLRQDAGDDAALGKAVIRFPNPYSVYLHDTPHQRLFKRSQRAFSSGCIRVENILELVKLLLNDSEKVDALIKAGHTRNVSLSKTVPVMLAYWTVELDENNHPLFKPDIYLRDLPALNALNQPAY